MVSIEENKEKPARAKGSVRVLIPRGEWYCPNQSPNFYLNASQKYLKR
jgi:hypothetical protein